MADECSKGGNHEPKAAYEQIDGIYRYWTECKKCGILLSSVHE